MRRGPDGVYLGLAAANVVAMSLVWFLRPEWRGELYKEGHTVELLTAGLFLAASLAALAAIRRAGLGARTPYLLIPAIALFCFLEEMSWGFHDLGFRPPRVLWLKIDGVHDLITLAFAVYLEHGSWRSRGLAAIGLAVALAVLALTRRRFLYPLGRIVLASAAWRLAAMAVSLIVAAVALDTDQLPWRYVKALEEIAELDAALGLLLAAFQIEPPVRPVPPPPTADEAPAA